MTDAQIDDKTALCRKLMAQPTNSRAEFEAIRERLIALNQECAAPINQELEKLGFPVVSSLKNSKIKYKAAIPVLIKWMNKAVTPDVKNTIIGALAVPWAKPLAAQPLLEALSKSGPGESFEGLRWQICYALEENADDSIADELLAIAAHQEYGTDRSMVVSALGRLRDPRAASTAIALLADPNVTYPALVALRKLAPVDATSALEPLLTHKEADIRKEAKKALQAIAKKTGAIVQEVSLPHKISNRTRVPSGFTEHSFNGDYKWLSAYFAPLSSVVTHGFGPNEIAEILAGAEAADENAEIAFDFPVMYRTVATSVRIGILLEDNDPDVYVYSLPDLVAEYSKELSDVLADLETEDEQ